MNPRHFVLLRGFSKENGRQLFDVYEDAERGVEHTEIEVDINVVDPFTDKSYAATVTIFVCQGDRRTASGNERPEYISLLAENRDDLTDLIQTAWKYEEIEGSHIWLTATYSDNDASVSFERWDFDSQSEVIDTTTAGSR